MNIACFEEADYVGKEWYYDLGVITGMAMTNKSYISSAPYLEGTVTNTEGIYYFDNYLSTSYTPFLTCTNPNNGYPYCPYNNYGNFFDYYKKESLSRFNFGVRFKWVVNDLSDAMRHP